MLKTITFLLYFFTSLFKELQNIRIVNMSRTTRQESYLNFASFQCSSTANCYYRELSTYSEELEKQGTKLTSWFYTLKALVYGNGWVIIG